MRNWKKATSVIFLAAASVYPIQGLRAAPTTVAGAASGARTETAMVKVLDEPAAEQPQAVAGAAATAGESAAQVKAQDDGTFSITVFDTDLVKVLRMLSEQSQRNIVASREVRGTITANLYNVTIREALDAVLRANGFGYREKNGFIYVYTAKELADIEKSERQMTTEVFRLHYTPASNAANMIKPVLSAEAQVSLTTPAQAGIDAGNKDVGGNSHAVEDIIVVRDYQDNIERVKKVLKELDQRPQQILVEATIVSASLSEDNVLGVDFTVLGGIDLSNIKGTPVEAAAGATSGNLKSSAAGTGTTGYTAGGTNFPLGNNGLKVGVVYDNVALFIQALEEITDTTVLANPKVLALNKQRGEVIVGKKTGYLTTTVTESATVQTVEFLETGTRLVFRPFVGDDGYIRMEIHPEDSDGGLNAANLPVKTTTEVTSNIMVKDGHTIIIGGLFRENSTSTKSQVPGIGNLPLLGALFRKQADITRREEIIILLTPHLVKDDAAMSEAAEKAIKDGEKMRVGVRRGMMCTGRERLAESYYDSAVREMAKPAPDNSKALWYLDCATNLNPMFLEAIDMKQRLSGQQLSSVDNSSVRYFVRNLVLAEKSREVPAPLPATQPVQSASRDPMTTEVSATQPAVAEADQAVAPATQPVGDVAADDEDMDWIVEEMAIESNAEAAPATQPAAAVDSGTPQTSVTELPVDQ